MAALAAWAAVVAQEVAAVVAPAAALAAVVDDCCCSRSGNLLPAASDVVDVRVRDRLGRGRARPGPGRNFGRGEHLGRRTRGRDGPEAHYCEIDDCGTATTNETESIFIIDVYYQIPL